MAQPYVGEIRMFGGNFAPNGWLFCSGQALPISENEVLFQLIGTTYGGDGEETFALPNLQSRVPLHMGTGPSGTTYVIGEMAGTEQQTLTTQQIPVHNHALLGSTALPTEEQPEGNVTGQTEAALYGSQAPLANLAPSAVSPAGGSQPHDNMQPYTVINYIISLFGVFPSQT
jgi:microcystin-dependent protein